MILDHFLSKCGILNWVDFSNLFVVASSANLIDQTFP